MTKENLETNLANLSKRKYCLLVSRGATALYLSYCSLKKNAAHKDKNKIVLPAIMCHSPANVAIYAGLEIIFCDVNSEDYTLDPQSLKKILETTPGILCVLSVSIFGHSPDMKQISEICKKFDVKLIDDAAQSIGGSSSEIPLGGWGDIGIYSFGHTKIIDVGWGGAILTDNELIYNECKSAYEALNFPSENINNLRSVYSEAYYSVEKLEYKSKALSPLFWNFPDIFKELYIYKEEYPENKIKQISEKLKQLEANIQTRKSLWTEYQKSLQSNDAITFPSIREGSAPWRFTCRMKKEKRELIVNTLRSQNIDVSTWYPSLANRFKPNNNLQKNDCPISSTLTEELLNLWIDPEKTKVADIKKTCDLINDLTKKI